MKDKKEIKDRVLEWLKRQTTAETTLADKECIDYLKSLVKATNEQEKIVVANEWVKYFEITYEMYPRKVGRAEAKKMYERKVRGLKGDNLKARATVIYKKVVAYVNQCREYNTEERYIKHFASWLNAEFEDWKKGDNL